MQNQMQIAIAPVNFGFNAPRDAQENSFEGTMNDIQKAKFDGCELATDFPRDPFLLHNSLKTNGLKVSSSQFRSRFTSTETYTQSINQFIDHMHFLNAVNSSVAIVCEIREQDLEQPLLSNMDSLSESEWALLTKGLSKIMEYAKESQMTVVYQPHLCTAIKTEADIDRLMSDTEVSLLIDTGHLSALNIAPEKLILKYADRIKYVYLKDLNRRVLNKSIKNKLTYSDALTSGMFEIPGEGSIKFDKIFKALRDIEYSDWVVAHGLYHECKATFATQAKNLKRFLKTLK